jgi:hypothetical protein
MGNILNGEDRIFTNRKNVGAEILLLGSGESRPGRWEGAIDVRDICTEKTRAALNTEAKRSVLLKIKG